MGSEQRGSKHARVRSQEWRGGAEKVRPPAGKRDESREKRAERRANTEERRENIEERREKREERISKEEGRGKGQSTAQISPDVSQHEQQIGFARHRFLCNSGGCLARWAQSDMSSEHSSN